MSHTVTFMMCLHTSTNSHAAPPKHTKSFLSRLLPKPKPVKEPQSTSFIHSLCPTCSAIWRSHGVIEEEAKFQTLEYRLLFHYHGPLTPIAGRAGGMVLLSQDIVLDAEVEVAGIEGCEVSDESLAHQKQLEAWWSSDSRGLPTRGSVSSSRTVWPAFQPHFEEADIGVQPIPKARVSIDRFFHADDIEIGVGGLESRRMSRREVKAEFHSDEFEFVNWDYGLAGPLNGDELERKVLQMQRQKRCVSTSGSASRAEKPLPPSPASPDKNKPLPAPPRPDSPRPGAAFDSEFPERHLPKGKYYPRFI